MLPAAAALTDALRWRCGGWRRPGSVREAVVVRWAARPVRREPADAAAGLCAPLHFRGSSWRLGLILVGVFVLLVSAWFWISGLFARRRDEDPGHGPGRR